MVDLSHSESDHDLYFPTISQAGLFRDGVQEYWSIKDLGQLKQLQEPCVLFVTSFQVQLIPFFQIEKLSAKELKRI